MLQFCYITIRIYESILYTVFLRIEVAPNIGHPRLEASLRQAENLILKAIAYRIPSNIGCEITTETTYKPRLVFEEIR